MRYRKEGCFTNDEHRQIRDQILNVIEQGTLSKEETLRRLDQLIENEINASDREINLYLVDACQTLMWAISTDNNPLPAFDAKRSYKGIRKRIRREARREKAQQLLLWSLPKLIPMAAILLLVVVLAGGGIHLAWFTNYSTPDEQQHVIMGHEVTVEMVATAIAENTIKEPIVVSDFSEFEKHLGFDPGIPNVLCGEWTADYAIIRYFSGYIKITAQYSHQDSKTQSITCVVSFYDDIDYAYFTFEQNREGATVHHSNLELYVSDNTDRVSACWYNNNLLVTLSGFVETDELIILISELIGGTLHE